MDARRPATPRHLPSTGGFLRCLGRDARRLLDDKGEGGRGQAMVEFAIVMPLQLFLTFAILQFIFLGVSALVVNYAAARATRAAVVGEDPHVTAALILAPLAGRNASLAGRDSHPAIEVPGWGAINGSDVAYKKVQVDTDNDGDWTTVTLEWDQELIFPFIDGMIALVLPPADQPTGPSAFGHDAGTGRIREHDGRIHFVITRSHTLPRFADIDYDTSMNYVNPW